MAHWGWYWKVKEKHQARTLCSKLLSIDAFKLFKNPNFSQFMVEPIGIKAELHEHGLRITYNKRKEHTYTIPVEKQSCHYGGYRYYFNCVLCKCRMRMLYHTGKSIFLCRQCLNLSYESQLLRPTRRYDHMHKKVTNVIASKGFEALENKPKGMHAATYERLRSLQAYYKQKSHQAMNIELRAWYGDKIEPHLDRYFDYAPDKPC